MDEGLSHRFSRRTHGETRQGRRQDVDPPHAYGHMLAGGNLESALLVLSACAFERRVAGAIAVRERLRFRALFDADTHALESACEDDLFDRAACQVARPESLARGGNLDLFGTNDGDDFVLAGPVERS